MMAVVSVGDLEKPLIVLQAFGVSGLIISSRTSSRKLFIWMQENMRDI